MKPGAEDSPAEPVPDHRRGVRLFVALHLGAVGLIYAVALFLGGGFSGPPMPPLTVAMASPAAVGPVPSRADKPATASPVATAPMPEWTQRAEVSAPWEQR